MKQCVLPRLLFAGTASGSGKTTVFCAVLRALVRRGASVAAFKCGPDYIDPMFHRACAGACGGGNLDLFLSEEDRMRELLAQGAKDAELALAEGAMGYYDGISVTEQASAYAVAQAAGFPVVLVVDCRGMAASVVALVKGFLLHRPDSNVRAVLFNRLPAALYPALCETIQRECGVAVAGYLPPLPDCALESRHLGLVAADEVKRLREILDQLADAAENTVDLALLLSLAREATPLGWEPVRLPSAAVSGVRIAIARDAAFSFYYAETLRLLEMLGARLLPFSPLTDAALPEACNGLLLGGGYPELFARTLSENVSMLSSVRNAIGAGMPLIAECGGFLYLHRSLENLQGERFAMAGVFAADGIRTDRLGRFGYQTMTANTENLLCKAGESLLTHEFHYWDSTEKGNSFTAKKPLREGSWTTTWATKSVYAGFPHLYLAGNPPAAGRFVRAAAAFAERKQKNGA